MRHVLVFLSLSLLLAGCDDDRTASDAGPTPGLDGGTSSDGGGPGTDGGGSGTDGGPVGGRTIGDPCTSDAECTDPPDAQCLTVVMNPFTGDTLASYPNGFCTKGCEEQSECGENPRATCVTQSSSGGGGGSSSMTCTLSCESDAECRSSEGYRCQMLFGFGFCTP